MHYSLLTAHNKTTNREIFGNSTALKNRFLTKRILGVEVDSDICLPYVPVFDALVRRSPSSEPSHPVDRSAFATSRNHRLRGALIGAMEIA